MTEDEKKKALITDYKVTFGGETGQRVLEDLSKRLGEHHLSFEPTNTHLTAFNEGRRAAIRYIRQQVDTDLSKPEQTVAITEEASDGG